MVIPLATTILLELLKVSLVTITVNQDLFSLGSKFSVCSRLFGILRLSWGRTAFKMEIRRSFIHY